MGKSHNLFKLTDVEKQEHGKKKILGKHSKENAVRIAIEASVLIHRECEDRTEEEKVLKMVQNLLVAMRKL